VYLAALKVKESLFPGGQIPTKVRKVPHGFVQVTMIQRDNIVGPSKFLACLGRQFWSCQSPPCALTSGAQEKSRGTLRTFVGI
jgi:hypothetical protein